jgi:hypothetical protein
MIYDEEQSLYLYAKSMIPMLNSMPSRLARSTCLDARPISCCHASFEAALSARQERSTETCVSAGSGKKIFNAAISRSGSADPVRVLANDGISLGLWSGATGWRATSHS